MSKVSIVSCSNYELELVKHSVRTCVDNLGGIKKFVYPGQKVLLKINLLAGTPPEKAVTTHPAVVSALAELVREAGAHPLVADSPGPVPYTTGGLKRVYRAAGFLEPEKQGVFELNWDTSVAGLSYNSGKIIKRFEVIKPVLDADVVIAVPKLKTHMFTTFTGATKILFGVIPGFSKAGYHAKLQTGEQFAEMLLDIIGAVQPALFIMDGILALEGDGPGLHGQPRSVGVVLGASDPVAMDAAACKIIGINPLEVPMLRVAADRGWWDGNVDGNIDGNNDSLEVVGEPLENVVVEGFKRPSHVARDARGLDRLPWFKRIWSPVAKQALTPRPVPDGNRCTGCATCSRVCPQKAVTIFKGKAVVRDRACIRCYCCHEMCPEAAVDLKYGLTGKVLYRLGLLGGT